MTHRFFIADVFTERAFGGNQLAVFPDAQGISDLAMQAYAREFNFPETAFVLPPERPGHFARVRIFTPKVELPFAGHPTVGTAAVLAHLGKIQSEEVLFEEGVGTISIEVERRPQAIFARFSLQAIVERPQTEPTIKAAAQVLSLSEADISAVWSASVGVPLCFVHLNDEDTVDRASLDRSAWAKDFAPSWGPQLYLFAGDTAPGGSLYARMFAPALGIDEDPATGGAAAAFAAAIGERIEARDGTFSWVITQGVAMGRPSRIEASARKEKGRLTGVSVGGPTVIVGEGTIHV